MRKNNDINLKKVNADLSHLQYKTTFTAILIRIRNSYLTWAIV